jgi:NTE family protein
MNNTNQNIKHLVICGGGIAGINAYGVLKKSNIDGFWNIDNIETIYGVSAGAMIAFIISLKYSWEDIDNYIIKRPWQNVFKFDIGYIIQSYTQKGIFNIKIIEDFCLPLLKGKDLDINTTMQQLYEYTNIELHLFTTDLHSYESVDICYKTHPTWKVIDAIYCSACLPIVFIPCLIDNKYYSDGGITNNYPIRNCIHNGATPSTIFGIDLTKNIDKNEHITEESTLFDYITCLINNMYTKMHKLQNYIQTTTNIIPLDISNNISNVSNNKYNKNSSDAPYEIELYTEENKQKNKNNMSFYYIIDIAASPDKRTELIEDGMKLWDDYFTKNIL